jgi:putative protein kinase ArgK-like GTPase of G3E family
MIFAINKIDKQGANPEKIKEKLAAMNLLVEDWGGKYQSHDISAKKGTGVKELLEKVLLEAESKQHASNAGSSAPSLSSPILPNPIQSLADEVGLFACSGEDDEKPGGPPPILTGRMARDFDWLWGRIPQEMREMGKKAEAQKAFKKLKIDNDLVQVIDIKIFMQEEDKKAKEARKEFAPRWCALSVYLNQRRWE